MSEEKAKTPRQWIDEAEEALNRTGEALRNAWNETKETRMGTLESAREAASRLGKAIDEGIAAARQSWDSSQRDGADDSGSAELEEPATKETGGEEE